MKNSPHFIFLTVSISIFIIVTLPILHLNIIVSSVIIIMVFLLSIIYIENRARKIALHELFLKNEWFDKVMISLADGLIVTDSNGIIKMINLSALSITGWKQQEVIGNHIEKVFEITTELTGLKIINPAVEAVQQNKIVPLANHTFLKQKNGQTIYIDDIAAPICNETGEAIGAILIFRDVSDKKKAEHSLSDLNLSLEKSIKERKLEVVASEKRYRSALDGMMEGVQIINFDWYYLYVNNAVVNQGKYTKNELLGHKMMEKFPGIENTEIFTVLKRCMQERISDNIETEFKFPDGLSGWFQMNITPVPEGLFILTINISELKNAEKHSHESELFSSAVLSSLSSHIAVVNLDGSIESVNKAWDDYAKENGEARLKNVSVGSNYFDVCKKSTVEGDLDAEKAIEGIKSVFNKEKAVFEMEYPCDSPTEQRWSNLSVSHFGDEEDKVIIVHEDITKRKLIEQANNKNETKYKRLFETAKDGILILNADTGKIEDVNPFLIKILGFSYNYFIGKELWEIGLFKDVEASKIAFLQLQEKEYIRYDDLALKTNVGKQLNVEFVSNVYLVDEQKVIQCNIRDITERKTAEKTLEQQNVELKKTNAELDRFVYSTSHDLRAPLTSVLGLINIMDESVNPAETDQKEWLSMMKQSIIKLDSFIEDIMNYSRNSRMEIEKEEINFEDLINESRRTLKYMENESVCKIKVEVVQTGKFISDRRRILIIMNNLISNAIKYHDKSKPYCYINLIAHSDMEKVIITLKDNGIGIADEKQQKIFEMFYRATSHSKGSGLGLYIAQETITKLNGTITLKSKLNAGTTFTITIPNLHEINQTL